MYKSIYTAETLLRSLSYEELYYTLYSISDNDTYLDDYLDNELAENFLYLLDVYDIIFIASDGRVLLTKLGEKILQHVIFHVELTKSSHKIKKKKKL